MTATEPEAIAAVAAARRAKLPVADWMRLAIREQIARERQPAQGTVVETEPREMGTLPTLSPDEVVAYLEAYRRVLDFRGKALSPNARILVAAERLLSGRLLEERQRAARALPAPAALGTIDGARG